MKRTVSLLLAVCMLLVTYITTGYAAEGTDGIQMILQIGNPMMTVNGAEKEIDPGRGTAPVIVDDRTLVPVRAIVEEMGGTVTWDEETQTAILTYGEDEIRLTLNSATVYLNNEAQTLDIMPVSMNDRSMLPLRFIAESFEFDVKWDGEQQMITIIKEAGEQTPEPSVPPETEEPAETEEPDLPGSNTLVVYFSCTGNTKTLAEKVQAATGGDIVEIVPAEAYTSADLNYNNSRCRANQELDADARPEIQPISMNMEQYDVILLGYPIWWGQCPPVVRTFLDNTDLTGKTIMPFCTSGSSGIDGSLSKIRELCPGSTVTNGFRGTGSTTEEQIESWLNSNGYAK